MANKATGPHIWVQGEPRKLDSLFNSELIPTSEGKHLDKCRKLMANYDSETAEDWREGIDTQLVVVCLHAFSTHSDSDLYLSPLSSRQ